MAIRIVRLGSSRARDEGIRIGTVRRPPRGVPKAEFATQNWYDVWLPDVAPSEALVKLARGADSDRSWQTFRKRYLAELKQPSTARTLDLLASLSHTGNFSVGCYCEDESRCHRSLLRAVLRARGAQLVE
jgi:uncharacterized protein YeaO (DUF488 family)